MVRQQPVPKSKGEEGASRSHRTHHHPGVQLVQEPQAERPGGRAERRVSARLNAIILHYPLIMLALHSRVGDAIS